MKKLTAFIAAAVMAIGTFSVNAFAADAEKTISLRIEGKSKTYFYGNVTTTAGNVAELMTQVNNDNADVTMDIQQSDYGTYITGINGDVAGSIEPAFYDGWSDIINGVAPSVGIDGQEVKDGDVIVFYYNDEYGSHGFAYPEIDASKVNEGVLKFTSQPIVKAVDGATVTIDGENYTTDENGEIIIAEKLRTNGEHSLQISKVAEDGIPLVLRYAPDYKVTFEGIEEAKADATEDNNTGVKNIFAYVVILAAAATTIVVFGRKKAYEK